MSTEVIAEPNGSAKTSSNPLSPNEPPLQLQTTLPPDQPPSATATVASNRADVISTTPANSTKKDEHKQKKTNKTPNLTDGKPDITLYSPVGGKPAIFKYSPSSSDDIIETIRWVAKEYQEFKPAIDNLLVDHEVSTYEDVKEFCDRYNKITSYVNKMNKGTSIALKTSSRASQGLLKHLMHHIYSHSVVDPEKLNQYVPFSSEVYGETSFEFVAQMIDDQRTRPREKDTFIDLGSGVGQVVLQIAASVDCRKCYGIEKADVPSKFSEEMEDRFRFWMDWFGKAYTEFEIFHGDFFDQKFDEIIKESTCLFINNFAFEPEVDHRLKLKFIDLKDGTRIISSKQFCPTKSRVTERDLSDIGSIMNVIEILPEQKQGSVSWTDKLVPYYLHTLDGSRVEKYYEKQKQRSVKIDEEPKKKRAAITSPPESKKSKATKKPDAKMADRTNQEATPKQRKKKPKKVPEPEPEAEPVPVPPKSKVAAKRKRTASVLTNDSASSTQTQIVVPIENIKPTNVQTAKTKKRRKSAVSNLDLLHEKTVESIAMDFSQPAPGCVDQSLNNSTGNFVSLPNFIINDLSMYIGSRNTDKLFESLKGDLERFNNRLKQPGVRESLLREIQREKEKSRELMYVSENLERHVSSLSDRANKAAGIHCDRLGIPNSSRSIISHLGALLNKHQELSKQYHYLSTYPIVPPRLAKPSQLSPLMDPPVAHSQSLSSTLFSPNSHPIASSMPNSIKASSSPLPSTIQTFQSPKDRMIDPQPQSQHQTQTSQAQYQQMLGMSYSYNSTIPRPPVAQAVSLDLSKKSSTFRN